MPAKSSLYNPRTRRTIAPRKSAPPAGAYTSREAAEVSGVPFFTIDYWGRTKFLVPTIAKGQGRGKGRQRLYSYADIIRLRIARELRDQKVSLETLRAVIQKLARSSAALAAAHFVLVGQEVETAADVAELIALLEQPDRQTFGVILDLRGLLATVSERAVALDAERAAAQPR